MKTSFLISIVAFMLTFSISYLHGQGIKVDETGVSVTEDESSPHPSAIFDIKSTTQGLLIPRMTTTQISSISSPAVGLLVCDITVNVFKYWDGTIWKSLEFNLDGANGLTYASGIMKLGGALSEATTITQSNYNMTYNLTGTGDFNIQDNGTSSFCVNDAGKVGIGTTAPDNSLEIRNSTPYIRLRDTDSGNSGASYIQFGQTESGSWSNTGYIGDAFSNQRGIGISVGVGDFGIGVGGSHPMTGANFFIESSNGNVGVGTVSPGGKLHVSTGTSGDCVLRIQADTDNNNEDDNPILQFYQDGINTIGEVGLIGSNGQVFTSSKANSLYLVNKEAAPIQLATNNVARITIAYDGKVGIGTNAPSHLLHVNGIARSTQSSWATSSDKRVKTDINTLSGSLDKIMQLRPVGYRYNDNYIAANPEYTGQKVGFIAQEVAQVMPEMVTQISETIGNETIDDFNLLDVSNLTPILVGAVKELKTENEELKAENSELKAQFDNLSSKVDEMEALIEKMVVTQESADASQTR